jgi:hypothetical protein
VLKARSLPTAFVVGSLVLLAGVLGASGAASAADRHATASTFASTFSAAQGGDTIYLAAGSYGTFTGATKASTVTIKPESGAAVTITPNFNGASNIKLDGVTANGVNIAGTSKNITISNTKITGMSLVNASTMSNAGILFDHDTFDNISACSTCYEGRLTVRGNNNTSAVGVAVTNSHFGNGGGSDGVQIIGDAYGVKIGPGNTFSGIKQGSYAAHVDSIQLYGSRSTQIVGNYFYNNDVVIMAPDGGTNEYIANNVMIGSGYVPAVQLGSHNGTQVVHNTIKDIQIQTGSKVGAKAGVNVNVSNNVFASGASTSPAGGSGCPGCPVTYNLFAGSTSGTNAIKGTPVFTGGSAPTTYAGYALAAGSPGKANAGDGKDRGINVGSTPPPTTPPPTTPPPTTPPPADTPAQAIWTAPSNVRVGQTVTLDGTASKGDAPLTCTWSFEDQSGATIWETITGCKLTKAFKNADTKYVKLTVRDKDGDTNASRKSFAVTA